MDEKHIIEKALMAYFIQWDNIYRFGGSDPNYEDGFNLNGIRNSIIYEKGKLEKSQYFPEIYKRETPPEIDNSYMANPDAIREQAKKSLEIYLSNPDYLYLKDNAKKVKKKEAESICLYNVLGYVSGLELFIKTDNLLRMRLHRNPDMYLDSFRRARKNLEKLIGSVSPVWQIVEEHNGQLKFV